MNLFCFVATYNICYWIWMHLETLNCNPVIQNMSMGKQTILKSIITNYIDYWVPISGLQKITFLQVCVLWFSCWNQIIYVRRWFTNVYCKLYYFVAHWYTQFFHLDIKLYCSNNNWSIITKNIKHHISCQNY